MIISPAFNQNTKTGSNTSGRANIDLLMSKKFLLCMGSPTLEGSVEGGEADMEQ